MDQLTPDAKLGLAVFNSISKGVDALHIKVYKLNFLNLIKSIFFIWNHVRDKCRKDYPVIIDNLRKTFPHPNTESAEQTFVWLGKLKKILNSMSKRKLHFFLHCLIKERNRYTEWCYANNIKPNLPQVNRDKLMISLLD